VEYLADLAACRGGGDRAGLRRVGATRVRAEARPSVAVQLDGEVVGHLPMTFDVVPAALSLVVP
jgi:diacylglycerol kinase family enzyme